VASFAFHAGTTSQQALRFTRNLEGVLAEQPTGRKLDGTIRISDTTSNGQVVLRVAVTGRTAGQQGDNKNVTLDT
jgi:hypothetical protein